MPVTPLKPVYPALQQRDLTSPFVAMAWQFAEGGGTTANDSALYGVKVPGTLSTPTWTTLQNGTGLSFNGSSDKVTLAVNVAVASLNATISNFAASGSSYSFAAWIKSSATTSITNTAPWSCGNTIIEARNTSTAGHAWSFGTEGGKVCTSRTNTIAGSGTDNLRVVSTSTITDNLPHRIVATVANNAVSMYIDGQLNGTGTFAGNATGDCSVSGGANNVYCQIGARTTNGSAYANFWSGSLGSLTIWNGYALSAADVVNDYMDSSTLFRRKVRRFAPFLGTNTPPPPATATQYFVSMGS